MNKQDDSRPIDERLLDTEMEICHNQLTQVLELIEDYKPQQFHCTFILAGNDDRGYVRYMGNMVAFKRILTERMCEDNTLFGCIHQSFMDAMKTRAHDSMEPSDESFHDKCWQVTKDLIDEMIHIPYDENHLNSFMLVSGNDRLNDVQIHGSYKTVADVLFEAAKKDFHLLNLLASAFQRAEKWYRDHPILPEYVEGEDDDEDAICFGS